MIELIEAIESKRTISFRYNGKNRRAEVYVLGTSSVGNLLCRCNELPVGGFKLFSVDKMENIKLENRRWYIPHPDYNRDGDKSMQEILKRV